MISSFLVALSLFCFLGIQALSSLCLASFFSFSRAQLREFRLGKDARLSLVADIMGNPERVLVTILFLGSMGSVLCQNLISYWLKESSSWFRVFLSIILSAVFAEIVPKVFALEHNLLVARCVISPFLRIHRIFYYPRIVAIAIANFLTFLFSFFLNDFNMPSLEEQIDAVDPCQDVHLISQEEKSLFQGYLRLAGLQVREVAKPTCDLIHFDLETSIDHLRKILSLFSGRELPVISGHPSNVIGILDMQHLLSFDREITLKDIRTLLKTPSFVPETRSLALVLDALGRDHSKIIFLVNEFGGVNGVVSLQIILRAIWGENDPVPDHVPSFFKRIDEVSMIASGRIDLEVFQRLSRVVISGRCGQTTLGGWIIAQCRELLLPGSVIELESLRIHILSVEKCHLKHLYIQHKSCKE